MVLTKPKNQKVQANAQRELTEPSWAESLRDVPETTNERLLSILAETRGPDILHVGCVNHRLPETLADKSHHLHYQLCRNLANSHIVGLDLAADGIEQLEQLGFDVVYGDAQNLEYQEAFDTIVAAELLEHLHNPGWFLRSCARALKPGGRLVLSTPNIFTPLLFLMYLKNYDKAFNPDHTMWFCPQTVIQLLRRCGFSVMQLFFVDDLKLDSTDSIFYRLYAHSWKLLRPFLPKRFRNTIIIVCDLTAGQLGKATPRKIEAG
jgi:2-polyprenyl-3-methyl-5-hydroxy-6-metoxy-1,4-benzoquinol methylase